MDAPTDSGFSRRPARPPAPGGDGDGPPSDGGSPPPTTSELVASWAALKVENDRLRAQLAERTRDRDESSARFHALVEGNADGIVVVDEAGVIQFANRRAADLFGLPLQRLVGTPFGHPVASGETTDVDLLPAGRPPTTVEMRVVRTEWSGRPACLASLRDITDRRRAEESARELIRAEAANVAKNELIAVISHDLRTPLHSIIGYADLLEMGIGAELGTKSRDFVRRIRTAAEHQVHLLDQLLTFSRLEAGALELRPRAVCVRELMGDVCEIVEPLAIQAGLALHVHAPDGLVVTTDPDALRQIVLNLATNAVKYTKQGDVRLDVTRDGDGTRIRVSDTGIGIAPEHLAHIFEPFWQAEPGRRGTGLGLSIVRRLARSLGGDVEVASQPGQGTSFDLRLPAEPPATSGVHGPR